MIKKEEVPAELSAKCEELSKWLTSDNCRAVAYLQPCEFEDEWRISVIQDIPDEQQEVLLCKYLQPTVDGHTLYLLVKACLDAEARGIEIGKDRALLSLFRQQCQAAGVGDGLKNITIERKVNGVVTTMSLSKNK